MTQHPRLLSPLTLRGHTLRNRIVFGAHTANMSDQGLPGPRFAAYLLERALGGAAMIVAEPVPVHRTGVLTRGNFLHSLRRGDPAFPQDDRTGDRTRARSSSSSSTTSARMAIPTSASRRTGRPPAGRPTTTATAATR